MINVGKMIAILRKERKMSQEQLAQLVNVTKQTISNYERGERKPEYDMLEAIADALNTPVSMLISREEQKQALDAIYGTGKAASPDARPLPPGLTPISRIRPQRIRRLAGTVAAGEPVLAEDLYDAYVEAPVDCDVTLTVSGDSMAPTYLDGDLLYIKQRPDVPDGAVAVVLIDDAATLKHVYHAEDGLILISDNTQYKPMHVRFSEHDYIAIFGIPVGYTRMFRVDPLAGVKKGFA